MTKDKDVLPSGGTLTLNLTAAAEQLHRGLSLQGWSVTHVEILKNGFRIHHNGGPGNSTVQVREEVIEIPRGAN